jgi:hypothetical protein
MISAQTAVVSKAERRNAEAGRFEEREIECETLVMGISC